MYLHFCQLCVCLHVIVIRKDMCPCNVKNASFVPRRPPGGGGGGEGKRLHGPVPPPTPHGTWRRGTAVSSHKPQATGGSVQIRAVQT